MLTITGTASLSDADGIMTAGPLTLDNATLTLTGESGEASRTRSGQAASVTKTSPSETAP